VALLGKSLVTRDLSMRDGLENKFQLSPLERGFVEWNKGHSA
jgi:hypothetical protein